MSTIKSKIKDNALLIYVDVPGHTADKLDLTCDDRGIFIVSKSEHEIYPVDVELTNQQFEFDFSKADCQVSNGLLTIVIPKKIRNKLKVSDSLDTS